MKRYKEVLQILKTLIIEYRSNFFFHKDYSVRVMRLTRDKPTNTFDSLLFLELYYFILSIANLFTNS